MAIGGLAGGSNDGAFVVAFESFEGPLDMLLDLARDKKIDLKAISILALADQFISYLERARALRLEIAGEYLVMAAWLAYLKSKWLLPEDEDDDEDLETLAETLAERLRMLESIRSAIDVLNNRPQLGLDRFSAGQMEGLEVAVKPAYRSDLSRLLRAYASASTTRKGARLRMRPRKLMTVREALELLTRDLVGTGWRDIWAFLPASLIHEIDRNGALAAHLVAGLELARQGEIEIDQREPFGSIRVRRR